jgi:tetratricopeptide (TPR) repeat protein
MKKHRIGPYIVWIALCILSLNTLAQVKEVPNTTSSKEALSFFIEGRDKYENAETDSAAKFFNEAIQKDPDFAMAYLYLSWCGGGYNAYRQNLDKAASLVDKVSTGEKLFILYQKAQADGDGQKQKEYIEQILKSYPSDKRMQLHAGNEYFTYNNDFSTAIVHYKKAIELDNNYAPAYNMMGLSESLLGNYKEAEEAFMKYIKLKPNVADSYDSYAFLLLKMGRYDESITQYKKALERNPAYSVSLTGLGNNYIFKGDYESARKYYQECFDKATDINWKFNALSYKATSFVYEGKIENAISTYDEYRALAEKENLIPNTIDSYFIQGFIFIETGNPAEGIKYYEKGNDLVEKSKLPEADKESYITSSIMWHIYFLSANGELDKATNEAEKGRLKVESRKNPGEEMFLNGIVGYLEIKKGNYDKGIQYLTNSWKENSWIWYYTAVAYKKKGDQANASTLFEKITKSNMNGIDLALVRKRASAELKK